MLSVCHHLSIDKSIVQDSDTNQLCDHIAIETHNIFSLSVDLLFREYASL